MLRIGLIGCGRISARHIKVLQALPELQLVAVCDRIEDRARAAASSTGATAYTDFEEMLRRERLDIVSILTESGSHGRIAQAVAPRVRILVIEKPMTLTVEDADRLLEVCDASSTRIFVVKQNRYNPPVVRLREALQAGRFGRLALGTVRVRWTRTQEYYDQDPWRGTWRDDGGVFANQASHHIDLLQWMMGPVESVQSYTATRLVRIETEDTGVAILRFVSGALGVIEATTASRPRDLEGSLSILGERGSVVISGFAVNRMETWNFAEPAAGDETVHGTSESPPNVYGYGHQSFYEDMLACVGSGRKALIDGIEARKTIELINALYESARTGAEVRLRYVPRGVPLGKP